MYSRRLALAADGAGAQEVERPRGAGAHTQALVSAPAGSTHPTLTPISRAVHGAREHVDALRLVRPVLAAAGNTKTLETLPPAHERRLLLVVPFEVPSRIS